MKLMIVSSKEDILKVGKNEQMVHLAFRPSNMDLMKLINQSPRLRAIQTPPSYHRTISKAARRFLEIQGIELLSGDVWGHRKDIDEYYHIDEEVVDRISSLLEEGQSIEETIRLVQKETKLSDDLVRYILKSAVPI